MGAPFGVLKRLCARLSKELVGDVDLAHGASPAMPSPSPEKLLEKLPWRSLPLGLSPAAASSSVDSGCN